MRAMKLAISERRRSTTSWGCKLHSEGGNMEADLTRLHNELEVRNDQVHKMQGIAAEFIALGALAGFLAALGATFVGYSLGRWVSEISYTIDPLLWIAGLLSGGLIVGITGTLATRKAVNEPPVRVLRNN